MSPETPIAEPLKQLFQRDPDLVHQLKDVDDAREAVDRVAAAAVRVGVSLDETQRAVLAAEIERKTRFLTMLRALIHKDGALAGELQAVKDAGGAEAAIMAAAGRQGVFMDIGELRDYLQLIFQMQGPEELSDDDLAAVSGGDMVIAAGIVAMGVTVYVGVAGAALAILGGFGFLSKKRDK